MSELSSQEIGIAYNESYVYEAHTKIRLIHKDDIDFDTIAILRLKNINCKEICILKMQIWMKKRLNTTYDYINIVSALIELLTGIYFKIASKYKYICSELIAALIKDVLGIDVYKQLFNELDPQRIYPYHFSELQYNDNVEVMFKGKKFLW